MTGVREVVDDAPTSSEDLARQLVRKKWRPSLRWCLEWTAVLVLALVAALLMRAYVFQTFFIPSGSMEPTLHIGDRIIVSKLSVEWGTINRGDILVFARPAADTADVCAGPPVNDLVKRVIGLPSEYLYNAGNSIYWSNARLGPWHLIVQHWSHYLPLGTNIGSETSPAYVPPGHYYMLGDNENNSCDSRYWGPISRDLVVGKVILRILPLSRFDFL